MNAIPSLACLVLLAPKRLPRKNVDFHLRFELKPQSKKGGCLSPFAGMLPGYTLFPRKESKKRKNAGTNVPSSLRLGGNRVFVVGLIGRTRNGKADTLNNLTNTPLARVNIIPTRS